MRLLITKHGLTVENEQGITQGWMPGRLSERGKKQVFQLISRLKSYHIDVIYSSELARSADTARMIAETHPEARLILVEALREKNHGSSEGRAQRDYTDEEKMRYHDLNHAEKYGESMNQMFQRVKRFYEGLLREHKDDTVLLVGHGGSVRALLCLVQRKEPKDMLEIKGLKGPSLSVFDIGKEGRYKILCLNCEEHLH